MLTRRHTLLLAGILACQPEPGRPTPGAAQVKANASKTPDATLPAAAGAMANTSADPGATQDLRVVYETMMTELADNIVRRTEEAAKHDYETLAEAKMALDEALPSNSLGQLDAVLAEAGIERATMVEFMQQNPDFVARVGGDFTATLATVEPALAILVAKVEALQPGARASP